MDGGCSCRACLDTNPVKLFNWNCGINDCIDAPSYVQCFTECTLLEPSPDLPQMLCNDCALQLKASYSFIKRCRESDLMLRLKQEEVVASELVRADSQFEWIDVQKEKLEASLVTQIEKPISEEKTNPIDAEGNENTSSSFLMSPAESLSLPMADEENTSDSIDGNSVTVNNPENQIKETNITTQPIVTPTARMGEAKSTSPSNSSNAISSEIPKHFKAAKKKKTRRLRETTKQASISSSKPQAAESGSRKRKPAKDEMTICEFCNKPYRQKALNNHIFQVHSGRNFLCDGCPRTFKKRTTLESHRKTHDPNRERKFTCNVCERKFLTQGNLREHIKIHDKNREHTFACDQCEKSFYYRGDLTMHRKIHTGEALQCKECQKQFLHPCKLKIHMRTHSGDKPFKCTYCDKAYGEEYNLTQHLLQHQGYRHKCHICGKEYSVRATFLTHMKQHTGLPLKCSVCGKGFVGKTKMRRHIGQVHKIIIPEEVDKLIVKVKTKREYI